MCMTKVVKDDTQLWLINSFKKSTNAYVENVVSRYQNFLKNIHKLRRLLCIELSRTDWVTISSVHGGRGMLTKGVVLLHDNARPHTAARTNALIKLFNWEIFDHPLYSPNLAPSDYHLFTKMKVWLATQRFHTNDQLMDGVNNWLRNLAAPFFDEGLHKLVSRHDKCLNVDGNYVEK